MSVNIHYFHFSVFQIWHSRLEIGKKSAIWVHFYICLLELTADNIAEENFVWHI